MAKIPKGLLGPWSGKIGNVVVCNGKYGPYLRALPRKKVDNPTALQQLQREKIKLVTRFLSALSELIVVSFNNSRSTGTAWGDAFNYTARNAIAMFGAKPVISYPAVLVSQGNLLRAASASATVSAPGVIRFDWRDIGIPAGSSASGQAAILVVYCESLNTCVFITNGAARSAGTDTIEVWLFLGYVVQTWVGFIAAGGKEIAPSIYTGELQL